MQTGNWLFNPGLVPTLATVLVFPLLLTLGFWQLERADQKQTLYDDYIRMSVREPVNLAPTLSNGSVTEANLWQGGTIDGHYVSAPVLLLDNQVHKGSVGYHVYAPFELKDSGQRILINRGWIAAGNFRDKAPDITMTEGDYTLSGVITRFPSVPGIVLDSGGLGEQISPYILRMQTITVETVEKIFGHNIYPYIFRLDAASPTGYLREWQQPGSGRERHFGYAFQWFSLAAVLLIIYISLNLRRRKPEL